MMIGGLLASGRITDRAELNFLEGRLREIEERLKPGAGTKHQEPVTK
jgi:hypothetical protein